MKENNLEKEYIKEFIEYGNFVMDGKSKDKKFVEKINTLMLALPEKEKLVIATRFPKDQEDFNDEYKTAELLGMSVDEVRQLEISAYRKLKNPSKLLNDANINNKEELHG